MRKKDTSACDCDVIHAQVVKEVEGQMLPKEDFQAMANLYKMYSDPTRLKILWALYCHEMCVCDLAVLLGMTKSAISHQLKSLRMANLVKFDKQGNVAYYSLVDCHVKEIFENALEHIKE